MPSGEKAMAEPSERDLRFAGYWVERGDLRRWLANIIAGVRREALVPEISEEEVEAAALEVSIAAMKRTIYGYDEATIIRYARDQIHQYRDEARAAIAAFLRVRLGS